MAIAPKTALHLKQRFTIGLGYKAEGKAGHEAWQGFFETGPRLRVASQQLCMRAAVANFSPGF